MLLPADFREDDEVDVETLQPIFYGDGSLAGDLWGIPIVKTLVGMGANLGIVFNTDEDVHFVIEGEEDE